MDGPSVWPVADGIDRTIPAWSNVLRMNGLVLATVDDEPDSDADEGTDGKTLDDIINTYSTKNEP